MFKTIIENQITGKIQVNSCKCNDCYENKTVNERVLTLLSVQ